MKFGGILVGWELPEQEEYTGDSAPNIQWLGGSDLELGLFIFPKNIPYSMGSQGATNRVSQSSNP